MLDDLTDGMDFGDKELVRTALKRAFPQLTAMQMHCLLLSLLGLTQEEIGEMLGIGRRAVTQHFSKAIGTIGATAEDLRN